MFKNDLFSENAHRYVKFRPRYPDELFQHIFKYCTGFNNAWDCGTGNGQVAIQLADRFKNIFATDISEDQIQYAGKKPNVFYTIQAAEQTNLPSNFFNLITCGQSYHWFNLEKFNTEVKRISADGAVLAIWGYYLPRIDSKNDKILDDFYHNVIYDYWEPERRHLENRYRDIYFPYDDVISKEFEISESWSKSHYFGYLSTWSFLKKFMKEKDYNPLADLFSELDLPDRFNIKFPVFSKIGIVRK